jgi:hypothetical protein
MTQPHGQIAAAGGGQAAQQRPACRRLAIAPGGWQDADGPASTSAVSASSDLPRALLSSSRPASMPATVHASPS